METVNGSFFLVAPGEGFEPTYKEWKHEPDKETLDEEARFEPTYKEWKQIPVLSF